VQLFHDGYPAYRMVIFRDVLHNALILIVTAIAARIGWLFVIEFVYTYPGVGQLPVFAINNPDLPLVRTVVITTVFMILVAKFTAMCCMRY
jgi:ABC-type dipeptide/oligopeptide/nickel transport system permease component